MNRSILIPAILIAASAARAEDAPRVAVSVKGTAVAVADTVDVEFTVSARDESSADAEHKYREKLGRVLTALKEGKAPAKPAKKPDKEKPPEKGSKKDDDEGDAPAKKSGKSDDDSAATAIPFEVSERGLTFGVKASKDDANPFKAIARMNGGPQASADPPMTFSSKVVATIKGVKKLDGKLVARRVALLIDLGIDAGADGTDSSTAPAVRFVIDDLEALRSKAYEDAMAKAKARALKLAKLGGRGLVGGDDPRASSVREGTVGGKIEDLQTAQVKAVTNMFGGAGGSTEAPSSFEVSVEVDLSVEFELAPAK